MAYIKRILFLLTACALILALLSGCGADNSPAASDNTNGSESTAPADEGSEPVNESDAGGTDFSYSDGLDENGHWENIKALDYVDLFDYKAMKIPAEIHTISDEAVQSDIDSVLAEYATQSEVTDRAVKDGDTVNIDYVGSIDGVEFEGGNTGGTGTDVTIGVTSYIDDFLQQLIGHTPGETIDVEVTFPVDYGQDELNGKDAVFVTTINHIVESAEPELTDSFVQENLSESYGWTTVDEMKTEIRDYLRNTSIQSYIQEYLMNDVTVTSTPEQLFQYQENAMINYFEESAASYSMSLDEFLLAYSGVASVDELLETNRTAIENAAKYALVIQAVAEDTNITVTEEDMANYFMENIGSEDYSTLANMYGLPYLKQSVLTQLVMDYIIENAVMA